MPHLHLRNSILPTALFSLNSKPTFQSLLNLGKIDCSSMAGIAAPLLSANNRANVPPLKTTLTQLDAGNKGNIGGYSYADPSNTVYAGAQTPSSTAKLL